MSAEVENLMYVSNEENQRFVPWHGLGTAVECAPTSAEAIKLAGLDWKVDSRPIYTANNIEIPGYKANTRVTDDKVLGIVTDRYQIVQNQEAFDFTDSLIGEGCTYETAGSLKGGKTIFLLARLDNFKVCGDDITSYICFTNNHTGTGAVRAVMTNTRVVCQNTLNTAIEGAARSWSTKHIGDLQSKLDEARNTLKLANLYNEKMAIYGDRAANINLSNDEVAKVIDKVFPIDDTFSDRKKNNVQKEREEFNKCIYAIDLRPFYGTAWGLINAAADYASHKQSKRDSDTYKENNFNKILNGRSVLDEVASLVAVPMN